MANMANLSRVGQVGHLVLRRQLSLTKWQAGPLCLSTESSRIIGMAAKYFLNGTIILADRVLGGGMVWVTNRRIWTVTEQCEWPLTEWTECPEIIDLQGGYLAPGYVDLHVHGGAGADFMDGTEDAFRPVCEAHARHG